MVGDELLPHDVAPLERGDDERVHIADGDTVADILGHLGEHEGGEIGVVLRGLDGLGGTVGDFDVVHHDRDAGVGGLVDQRAQGGGSTMVHDDAGDAGLDRGFHVGGLSGIVGPRVVELHAEADRVGLLLGALGPQLEVVTGAAVLDQGDLHRPFVEGSRLLSRCGTCIGASRTLLIAVAVLGAGDEEENSAQPEAGNRVAPHLIPLSGDLGSGERRTHKSLAVQTTTFVRVKHGRVP